MDSKKLASGRAMPLRVCRYIVYCLGLLFSPGLLADGAGHAAVLEDQVCMQDRAGFDLGCTANDISIAGVENLEILDDGCAYPGDEVTFRANFRVLLTAQERHDVGLWFALDGDPNSDGALSGTCTVATPAYAPDAPWLDLDGMNDGGFCSDGRTSCKVDRDCKGIGNGKCTLKQDTCGDVDGNHNPLFPGVTLTVKCVAGNDAGDLLVPNCTSWRQPGSNDLCTSPLEAFPGAPSKCKCDNGFTVPIKVPPAVLKVTKSAEPAEVKEPGGDVTYTVTVTNVGIDPNNGVILTSLLDSIYGDITAVHGDIKETHCAVGGSIPSDDGQVGGIDTYTCSFVVSVSGNAHDEIPDTVTASAIDARGNTLSGYDNAKVTITDALPDIDVTKVVSPNKLSEPGGNATFTVTVANKSVSSDPVTITTLTDNTDGTVEDLEFVCLDTRSQSVVGQTIPAGGSVSCTFTRDVTGNAGYVETDTVTARGTDDDGNPIEDSDSATVTIEDVKSSITLTKTATPDSLDEPAGNVDFTVVITNTSSVDAVTINTLTDTIGSDEKPLVDCSPNLVGVTIPAGGSVSCTFSRNLQGQPGNPHVDTVTTTGRDDDGEDVMAADDATVPFKNVIPSAVLSKSATAAVVTYTVTVTNQSDAEELYLDGLVDNKFGPISAGNPKVIETNCSTSQTLQPHGQTGDSYSCWFKAEVSCSPHTNTLTGYVNDDDGSATIEPSGTATVTLSGATGCQL